MRLSTHDGMSFYPHLESWAIDLYAEKIIQELSEYLLELSPVFRSSLESADKRYTELSQEKFHQLFVSSCRLHCYGVIYFIRRKDVQSLMESISNETLLLDDIYREGGKSGFWDRAWNYAIHRFIERRSMQLTFSREFTPRNAFATKSRDQIIVNKFDFVDTSSLDSFFDVSQKYDFHDFSHFICATICPEMYGCHYQLLLDFPEEQKRLIKSPRLRKNNFVPLCDGVIFSEYLTPLFAQADELFESASEGTRYMASSVLQFLVGSRSIKHPSSGLQAKLDRCVDVRKLLILSQNKCYELPASELEGHLFVRGGEGDELKGLQPSERLHAINRVGNGRFFYERRNVLKHRAHRLAYEMAAQALIKKPGVSPRDKKHLMLCINILNFKHQTLGHNEQNLFSVVSKDLKFNEVNYANK